MPGAKSDTDSPRKRDPIPEKVSSPATPMDTEEPENDL